MVSTHHVAPAPPGCPGVDEAGASEAPGGKTGVVLIRKIRDAERRKVSSGPGPVSGAGLRSEGT